MEKLNNIICDWCRTICTNNYISIDGKKRSLHYCSEECVKKSNHILPTYYKNEKNN